MNADNIFISYSRSDSAFVRKLEEDLAREGVFIWFDQKRISAGKLWDRAIEEALESSGILIVGVSPKSALSENVANEVQYAREEGKIIVPILIEQTKIPLTWRRYQRIDFYENYEAGLNELAQTLKNEMSQLQNRGKENEEQGLKEEAEAKAKEENRRKEEEEAKRKSTEEQRLKLEAEANEKAEEERRIKTEAEARRIEEEKRIKEELRLKEVEEAKQKNAEEQRIRAEAEAKRIEEEKVKEELRKKAEEEKRIKAELEAKQKAEEERRIKADAEAKRVGERKVKEELLLKEKAKAEEEKRLKDEAEVKRKNAEEQRLKAEVEAKQKAEEERRIRAEAEAKKIEEEKRIQEELRLKTEVKAKQKADEEIGKKDQTEGIDKKEDSVEVNTKIIETSIQKIVRYKIPLIVVSVIAVLVIVIWIVNSEKNNIKKESKTATITKKPTPEYVTDNNVEGVKIGNQIWMTKNLHVSTYLNGDPIEEVKDRETWANLTTGAWCYYNNDPANGEVYGKLYNWYAVNDPRGLAPKGWHIPTDDEWATLIKNMGGYDIAGGKLKESGTAHWESPNNGATNESGFSALPGGYRYDDGYFYYIRSNGFWWSSTESSTEYAWYWDLGYSDSWIGQSSYGKEMGFSVRCVRD